LEFDTFDRNPRVCFWLPREVAWLGYRLRMCYAVSFQKFFSL
jgi:hypothetical protein